MKKQPKHAAMNAVIGRKPVKDRLREAPETVDLVYLDVGRKSRDLSDVMRMCRKAKVRFALVPVAKLDAMYPGNHQGCAARLFEAGFVDLDEVITHTLQGPLPVLLALDQVQDTGNAGTLIRTLYGIGGGGLVIPKHNSVYLGPDAAKAAAGTLDKLPIAKVANLGRALDQLTEQGFTAYAAHDEEHSMDIGEISWELPAVVVLGNEDKGIREGVRKRCQVGVRIPLLRKIDSLNVAQAGAMILSRLVSTGS